MIAVRWFMPILVALVATLWHVVPWLSRRERLFGATVTEEFRERERPALVREYELRLLPWTVAAVAGSLLLPLVTHPFWIWDIGFWLAVVLGGGWNVWRMFSRIPRAASGAARVRRAELTAGDPDATRSWTPILVALLAVPLGALAATAAYLHEHRAQLPERFPMHWDLQGAPNRWAERTAMGVYAPLAVGGALTLMMAAIALAAWWGARRSVWSSPVVVPLVGWTWTVGGLFTMMGLLPLHYFPLGQVFGFAGGMMTVIVVVTVIAVRRMQRPDAPRGEMTPDTCWHGGIFYYNPQDPALLVEKRIGVGWTFNFAHPVAWLILALLVAVPVGIAILRWWPV
jgi:uncharacterized membrane protein